jgi:hypothetical protein
MSAVTLTVTVPATTLPQTEMTAVGVPPSFQGHDQQVKSRAACICLSFM